MPDTPMLDDDADDERAARMNAALAETQQLEREERDADLARQVEIDQALSEALSKRPND